jgi:hypothetical protein
LTFVGGSARLLGNNRKHGFHEEEEKHMAMALKKNNKKKQKKVTSISYKDIMILALTGNQGKVSTFFETGMVSRNSLKKAVIGMNGRKNAEMFRALAEKLVPGITSGTRGRRLPRNGESRTYKVARRANSKAGYVRIPVSVLAGLGKNVQVNFDAAVVRISAAG